MPKSHTFTRGLNLKTILLTAWLMASGTFLFPGFLMATAKEAPGEQYGAGAAELKRGERLFYGLIEGKGTAPACATCHIHHIPVEMHWYPSAWEIANLYKDRDISQFKEVLLNPITPKMSEIHVNFNFTDSDIEQMKGYLDYLAVTGPSKPKPIINNILLFLFLGLVMTYFLVDLIFLKKIRPIAIHWMVIALGVAAQLYIIVPEAIALGRSENYEPDQPIKFSHRVHVEENNIDCRYCHHTVETSKSANIPENNLCLNCHELIREGTHSGRFEINKIHLARETGEAVDWIRVHNLPDHVYFSHAQHVGVAGLDCTICHGEVEKMDRVRQVSDLSMGWCVNCHRDTEVAFFDNEFYKKYEELHRKIREGEIDRVSAEMTGGLDCSKCHY